MSADAWVTAAVVVAVLVALVRELAPPPFVLVGAVIFLLIIDVITAAQAFAGFANPAPITVAALYIVARAVQRTGAVTAGLAAILPHNGNGMTGVRSILLRLLPPTILSSALLNNTPIVAMLAPAVARQGQSRGIAPSKLLIPISYAAIVGGTITAIGTSTTLVVSGLMEQSGMTPLALFEPLRLGLPLAIGSLLLMIVLAPILLPERRPAGETFREGVREFTLSLRVVPDGVMAGQSMADAGLRGLQGVYCVRILRGDHVISPVGPDTVLEGDDELTFVGDIHQVVDLQQRRGLVSTEAHHLEEIDRGDRFFEAVIGPSSPLVNRSLKATGFRNRYGAAVLAIHRSGELLNDKLGEIELRVGDTLLIVAGPGFAERWRVTGDFVLIASAEPDTPLDVRGSRITLTVVAALLLLAGFGILPILEASLLATFALVATGVMTANQAQTSVDLPVVVVIAAAFGLGAAVESSGLAMVVARALVWAPPALGDVGVVLGIVILTLVLTEIVTNNAAAVLVFPVAVSAANTAGLPARPLLLAVAVGASLSFLTPIGYQTNLMVYGLGNYRFGDFARIGAPVSLFCIAGLVGLTTMAVT